MKRSRFVVLLVLSLGCWIAVSGAEVADHPLLTRYPGSTASRSEHKDFDRYNVILGIDEDGEFVSEALEGSVTRTGYYQPKERSILEVSKNYEDALKAAGAEILWLCENEECGPAYAASAWNRFNGITTKSGADCRYLAARLDSGDGTAYVAIMVGRHRHQVDIVELAAMETGLVSVTAEAIRSGIDRDGQVVLDGIFFDTDKAEVKSESQPALTEIARYLKEHEGKFFVVGHTDISGGLAHNMDLSRSRAASVVQALTQGHGIAAERLEAHGVGPLAPATTNANDGGRSRNRRVVLVKR